MEPFAKASRERYRHRRGSGASIVRQDQHEVPSVGGRRCVRRIHRNPMDPCAPDQHAHRRRQDHQLVRGEPDEVQPHDSTSLPRHSRRHPLGTGGDFGVQPSGTGTCRPCGRRHTSVQVAALSSRRWLGMTNGISPSCRSHCSNPVTVRIETVGRRGRGTSTWAAFSRGRMPST